MFSAVLFDMDGVIIDSEPLYMQVEQSLFGEFGLTITKEEQYRYVGTRMEDMWAFLKEEYGLEPSVQEIAERERKLYGELLESNRDIQPIPGIVELLRQLKEAGYETAVASSSGIREIRLVLKMFELENQFSVWVSGEEVKKGKPAPDIFLQAADRLGMAPEQCVVIEDSMNGIRAGKAAGMKCIGFANPNSGKQDLSEADLVVGEISRIDEAVLRELLGGLLQ